MADRTDDDCTEDLGSSNARVDRGLNDLIHLATAIGGARGSSSRLELLAKVQVTVPGIGAITYPNEISIVDRQFSN
jgi:hypothetical protein